MTFMKANIAHKQKPSLLDRFGAMLSTPSAPIVIAVVGGILFLGQAWIYIHTQASNLDEGAYVYKGYLFVTGQYTPYQDYGPWSNKMPLSFLIPGFVQYIFGPGLDTARYFTFLLAGLIVLGVWILANRLGNRWWGAATVWIFALNPAVIKMYSIAASQVLVAFLLTWTLVFTLGKGRKTWQIMLGAFLAGVTVMTRINVVFVLPLLVLYILWEHGWKLGLLAAVTSTVTMIIFHALFWPGILIIWAHAIPKSLSPFLDEWRPLGVVDTWKPALSTRERILALFSGIRLHFIAVAGVLTTWILWPRRSNWKSQSNFRVAVFLTLTFILLSVFHLYASIGQDFCVFCFSGYISFFSMIGILLVVASFSSWKLQIPLWLVLLIFALILIITTGIGFSAFEDLGETILAMPIPRMIIDFPSLSTESVPLEAVLINKFNFEYSYLRRLLPAAAGLIMGLFIIIAALLIRLLLKRVAIKKTPKLTQNPPSLGYLTLLILLLLGLLLSPTKALGGGKGEYDCPGDALRSYEAAGSALAKKIPPGSSVYWKGNLSAIPLIYVPGITIYPSQINASYSLKQEGEEEMLLKFGFWSPQLAEKWILNSDFVLIEQQYFKGWEKEILKSDHFEELEQTPPVVDCRESSRIRVFKRIP